MTRVIHWTSETPCEGPACIAIGVFDGVHLGHQELLRSTVETARSRGVLALGVTFDRDPEQVITPQDYSAQLLSLADKCRYMCECGLDAVVVIPFTPELAALGAEEFLDTVVSGCCDVSCIHVGSDFRFGAHAAGTVETLRTWAAGHGADVYPHNLLEVGGAPVTATRIRGVVASGDMRGAGELLGRFHAIRGQVHSGRGEGTKLGFPTANLMPLEHAALPADGVYAGYAVLEDGLRWPAAISVGVPPTFPDARDYLEVHVIEFKGDLVGADMLVGFIERLRSHRAFSALEDLIAAIRADVARAQDVAEGCGILLRL